MIRLVVLALPVLLSVMAPTAHAAPAGLNLGGPLAIAVDRSGALYLTDDQHMRVIKISPADKLIAHWGTKGSGAGQLNNPQGIAVAPDGTVYVADAGNNRIERFTSSGHYLGVWSSKYHIVQPVAIAVDAHGNLYAQDANENILKISPAGKVMQRISTSVLFGGTETGAGGFAIDAAGTIYITDADSHVDKISASGKLLGRWGKKGTGKGQFGDFLGGLALDRSGNLWIADSSNHRIQVINSSGKVLAVHDLVGDFQQEPNNIAIDRAGHIYVVVDNQQVEKIAPSGKILARWG